MPPNQAYGRHKCGECGMELPDQGEFHPYAFCILFKAGYTREHIWTFVREASTAFGRKPGTFVLVRNWSPPVAAKSS